MVNLVHTLRSVCCLFLFWPLLVGASSKDAAIEQILPTLEKKIINTMQAQHIPGMAIAIVSKDKIYYLKGFGVKQLGKKDKVASTTLFQIASLSKPVNATLLAILQDKGKIALEDPVHYYLPHFNVRTHDAKLRIAHLLSHSSGFPNNGFNEMIEAYAPRTKIITRMQRTRPLATPGKRFEYHNVMYGMSGDAVISATGKPFEQAMREYLFQPLGMKRASVGLYALLASKDRAYPHIATGKGRYVPASGYSKSYYAFPAAGGVNASVEDLVPFLQLYLGKPSKVVSQRSLQQLTYPYIKNPQARIILEAKRGSIQNTYYGLGWHSMLYANKKVIYHQGHLKGFRNFIGFMPDNVGIVILTNADRRHAGKLAMSFFDLYVHALNKVETQVAQK